MLQILKKNRNPFAYKNNLCYKPNIMEKLIENKSGDSPLVLSMPHSGLMDPKNLPEPIKDNYKTDERGIESTIKGADYAVPDITNFHLQNEHSRVSTNLPRVCLDVNRSIDEVDGISVEGGGEPGHANGLIWWAPLEKIDKFDIPEEEQNNRLRRRLLENPLLKRPYTKQEFQEILSFAYNPYIEAINLKIREALEKHGLAVLLDLHTLPGNEVSVVQPINAYFAKEEAVRGRNPGEMPDLILITNEGKSCHPKISEIITETFEKAGLIVAPGKGPFKGDHGSTALYADPAEGKHVVGMEFVGHDIEKGRTRGEITLSSEQKAIRYIRSVYNKMFSRLANLKKQNLPWKKGLL
ncbi:hypothetical protein GF366_04870 [Candidatus Peregrinibacteria bacterium]|nr:hypothetical protein [Candidatus Peregrinibacteria bacterium]